MRLLRLPAIVTMVGLLSCAAAENTAEKADVGKAPAVETKKAPEKPVTLRFGNVLVNVTAKRVEVTGTVCLEEGVLDYLGVTRGGQEYESVLALDCKGSHLHAGLVAIGAVAGPTKTALAHIRKDPPKGMKIPDHTGTPIAITAQWTHDGKTVTVPAEHLLHNRAEKKLQQKATWVFTGSYFAKAPGDEREAYMADIDMALIAVIYMGSAVINVEEDAGNPYADEAEGYEVNRKLTPPAKTPVKLTITLIEEKKQDTKKE